MLPEVPDSSQHKQNFIETEKIEGTILKTRTRWHALLYLVKN